MAFDIDLSQDYPWPVEIGLAENGSAVKHGFNARFKRMEREEIIELVGKCRTGKITDLDVCKKVLVGWEDVVSGQGNEMKEIPFNKQNFEAVMKIHPVATNVAQAWIQSTTAGILGN